jgi:hypothetical protein
MNAHDEMLAIRRILKVLQPMEPSAARRVLQFVIDHSGEALAAHERAVARAVEA